LIHLDTNVVSETSSRILSFDLPCAKAYATIVSNARTVGRSIGFADGLIAAMATARDLTVATRDTAPFISAGLRVVNPWIVT
jgi:predicted nucleic acid-binding protein